MMEQMPDDRLTAMGPCGNLITSAALPKSIAVRWTPKRKAEVMIAISKGLIPLASALRRYRISEDEFHDWTTKYENGGLSALTRKRYGNILHSESRQF